MSTQFTLLWAVLRGVHRGSATAAGIALMIFAVAAGADSLAVVDPLPPGPYVVGCSNVEQDFRCDFLYKLSIPR